MPPAPYWGGRSVGTGSGSSQTRLSNKGFGHTAAKLYFAASLLKSLYVVGVLPTRQEIPTPEFAYSRSPAWPGSIMKREGAVRTYVRENRLTVGLPKTPANKASMQDMSPSSGQPTGHATAFLETCGRCWDAVVKRDTTPPPKNHADLDRSNRSHRTGRRNL